MTRVPLWVLGAVVVVAAGASAAATAQPEARAKPEARFDLYDFRVADKPVEPAEAADGLHLAGPGRATLKVRAFPGAFLCRLAPDPGADVVQMSVGRVYNRRCNALYNPRGDAGMTFTAADVEITWLDDHFEVAATAPLVISNVADVYRVGHQLPYFQPLDRSRFPRAPAGWCSWYEYGQSITEAETLRNVEWLKTNLQPFGLDIVQIDDGWQGKGFGSGENRDWFTTDAKKFPHGMKALAGEIRRRGFMPGLWLIPFGESDEDIFKKYPSLFIRRPDGSSIGEDPANPVADQRVNWIGRYLLDPSGLAGQAYLRYLAKMVCPDWGYDYIKIDGEGGLSGIYKEWGKQISQPKLAGSEAYRAGLKAFKGVMGPDRILLNCGGAYDSAPYCDAIRTGGDVGASWTGMQPAIRATFGELYKNHIGWWTDPDAVCVRPPLTLDQARLWVTLVGLTGQLLMASDNMTKLPAERVELLKRIYPVADVRPMDLYPIPTKAHFFDLKVDKPGVGAWDVVAAFNWHAVGSEAVSLDPVALGLPPGRYSFYDVWAKRLVGVGEGPLPLLLAPSSCQVIAVRPQGAEPVLVGDSRHLTQGADDLLASDWDATTRIWSGRSVLVAGDPYELRFTLPPGWRVDEADAQTAGHLACLTLRSDKGGPVSWRVRFHRTVPEDDTSPATGASLAPTADGVTVSWAGTALAWHVYRDGQVVAQVAEPVLRDQPRPRAKAHVYEAAPVGWSDQAGPRRPLGTLPAQAATAKPAPDAWLDALTPESAQQDWGELRRRTSVEGAPMTIAGHVFTHGLGTHANSEIVYNLHGGYRRFTAQVGVDDEKRDSPATVVFQVWVDGAKQFDSGVMRGGQTDRSVDVALDGADELRLVVTDAGDGINSDHADWGDAHLIGAGR